MVVIAGLAAGWFFALAAPISTYTSPIGTQSVVRTAFNAVANKLGDGAANSLRLKGEERDRINILFLGMPGGGNDAPFLTDTLIIASIKPSTSQLALMSLPRDLLVELTDQKIITKINALFRMNELNHDLIINKVKEITGQPIDYYAVMDISAAEKITDALGGLNVLVPDDINDTQFPTPDHGVETFSVQKGWRFFDGATIQKYLRTRHSPDGDFARMRQQQAVIEAIRKKIFGFN
ncbi:MAG: LCP family protein, partial [Patescibacteria group bacterium]